MNKRLVEISDIIVGIGIGVAICGLIVKEPHRAELAPKYFIMAGLLVAVGLILSKVVFKQK